MSLSATVTGRRLLQPSETSTLFIQTQILSRRNLTPCLLTITKDLPPDPGDCVLPLVFKAVEKLAARIGRISSCTGSARGHKSAYGSVRKSEVSVELAPRRQALQEFSQKRKATDQLTRLALSWKGRGRGCLRGRGNPKVGFPRERRPSRRAATLGSSSNQLTHRCVRRAV